MSELLLAMLALLLSGVGFIFAALLMPPQSGVYRVSASATPPKVGGVGNPFLGKPGPVLLPKLAGRQGGPKPSVGDPLPRPEWPTAPSEGTGSPTFVVYDCMGFAQIRFGSSEEAMRWIDQQSPLTASRPFFVEERR